MTTASTVPEPWTAVVAAAGSAVAADECAILTGLLDTVIRDLFSVGLTLQIARDHMDGPAIEPMTRAIDGVDHLIHAVRDHMFELGRQRVPDGPAIR